MYGKNVYEPNSFVMGGHVFSIKIQRILIKKVNPFHLGFVFLVFYLTGLSIVNKYLQ